MFEFKAYAYTTASLVIGLLIFQFCADKRLFQSIGKRFLAMMVIAQAAAFLSPNIVIYNVIAGLTLLICCLDRRMIVPSYLFLLVTLPMTPKTIAAGGVYILSWDISISLGIAAMLALAIRSKGSFSRSVIWDIPVTLLFILFVAASARSTTATNTMRVCLEQASILLLPYFIVSRSLRSFDDLRDALYGIAAGVAALSTLAVYEALHTWPLFRIVSDRYGIILTGDASVKVRAGFLRSAGPFTEPTSFSFCLALGILAAVGGSRLFPNPLKRAAVLAMMAVGILATQSRGGWAGVIVGVVIMNIYDARFGALAKKAGVAAMAVLLVFAAAKVDTRVASAAGLNAEGEGTVEYRKNLLDRGLDEIRRHPVAGETLANVRVAMVDMTQGEGIIDFVNTYLFVALISGLVGLAVFMSALLTPVGALWAAKARFARQQLQMFRRMSSSSTIFGSLIACMVMIAATSMTGRTTMLIAIYIGFASAILNAMQGERRKARAEQAASADDLPVDDMETASSQALKPARA